MKNILILGAGMSATSLIRYILENSKKEAWKLTLGDINEQLALEKIGGHANGTSIRFDLL